LQAPPILSVVGERFANYGGQSPKQQASELLRQLIAEYLVPELARVPKALIVPMGTAVSGALVDLGVTNADRCLIGFPRPSGANGHGLKQFQKNRLAMTQIVSRWVVPLVSFWKSRSSAFRAEAVISNG
jgi:hypothetical protein